MNLAQPLRKQRLVQPPTFSASEIAAARLPIACPLCSNTVMPVTLQSIFQTHFDHFARRSPLADYQREAGCCIRDCRTPALGGHVVGCPQGHVRKICCNSCRHRNCPLCSAFAVPPYIVPSLTGRTPASRGRGVDQFPCVRPDGPRPAQPTVNRTGYPSFNSAIILMETHPAPRLQRVGPPAG